MANVQISDLPFATLPLVGATTFFEVEATEGGVVVSRRIAADDLTISVTSLVITGTSTDDPSIGAGTFDGRLLWENANALQTGVFGFDPAGDNFIWSNDAEGGFHQITIRDGTVLVETIAAAAGGLLVNNLSTGAGLERVLTIADLFTGVFIGTSTDDPAVPGGTFDAQAVFQNANLIETAQIGFNPAGDTFRVTNRTHAGVLALTQEIASGVSSDFYSFDGDTGRHLWLDSLNSDLLFMELIAGVKAVTVFGDTTNNPATGNGQKGQFRIENQSLAGAGFFGFPESGATATAMDVSNLVHGGPVRIVTENLAAGTQRVLGVFDPDTGIILRNQDNTTVLTTVVEASGGVQVLNTVTGGGLERVLTTADLFAGVFIGTSTDDPTVPGGTFDANAQWQNANLLPLANVGFSPAGDTLFLASQVHGGKIILRGEDEAGNVRDVYEIDFENVVGGLAHLWREPGGTQLLMRLDTGINAVTQVANSVNQPSGGFAQVGVFRVRNRNATPETAFTVGFNETIGQTTLELKNFVHGGAIELIGETAAGLERVMFFTDPDQRGPIIFGLDDNNPATDASIQDARMTFRNPSAQNIWQIGFLEGTNDFSLKLFQDTGVLQLRGSDAASADVLMASFDPVGAVQLMNDGDIRFLTSTVGAAVRGSAVDAVTLIMEDSAGTDMLTVSGSSTLVTFVSERDGSTVRFRGSDLGASIRTLWEADPDGEFNAYRAGVRRAGTRFDGWTIFGVLANSPVGGGTQDLSLNFENLVGALAGAIRYTTSIDMRIDNFVEGGDILISAEDVGGTQRSMIFMDPDGPNSILLHEVGVAVARTATAALGGLFANNTLTGAGFERVLTTADRTDASVYTRNATIVEDRTLLASASATILNNNNVLAALIADLQSAGVIQ